jgi:hypothetical protein
MENIISEFRVIETDDGFRIEIKGDKEKLRPFFTGAGSHGAWPWGPGRSRRGPWGMFGFHPGFGMRMGHCWGDWGFEPEEEEKGGGPKEA